MIKLPDNFFSVIASEKASSKISMLYKMKAIQSVEHIVKCFRETVSKEVSEILLKTKAILEYKNNATSEFYHFNYRIISAIKEKKDIKLARKALEDFSLIPSNNLIKRKILIKNINDYHWAMEFMNCTEIDANKINGESFSRIIPVNNKELPGHICIIDGCLQSLEAQLSTQAFFQEINDYVSHIILYDGTGITGSSSTRTMGAIYIRIPKRREQEQNEEELSPISLSWLPPFVYYLEQLIHETAHLHLDQLMEFDPLILNPAHEKYVSPIRKDPRPMRGIFHATYVLARLYLFYSIYNFKSQWSEELKDKRKRAIADVFKRGLCVLNESAILTDRGRVILVEMEELLNNGGCSY